MGLVGPSFAISTDGLGGLSTTFADLYYVLFCTYLSLAHGQLTLSI